MNMPKDLRAIAKAARKSGWRITTTNGGHLRWISPIGAIVITPSTPSDWRSLRNTKAELRRKGCPGC